MKTIDREGEVRLGSNSPTTENAEKEERRRIREGDVSLGGREAAKNPAKRIRPLADLISGPDERPARGNLLFPVFPETENTIWTPLPNLPAEKGGESKGGKHPVQQIIGDKKDFSVKQIIGDSFQQIIGERKDFAPTSPKSVREVSKTTTPLQRVAAPSASSRIVFFPEEERKSGSEAGIEYKKLGYESETGFDRVRLGRVSRLISKSARDFTQKKRQEGSPYR